VSGLASVVEVAYWPVVRYSADEVVERESVSIQMAQCRSLCWPFPMLQHKYIFQMKYMEAILSNSTRKLLRFEITKKLIAV